MKTSKLDRRHNGYGHFKYCVTFRTTEISKFCEIRNWCWQTWGPSTELEFWEKLDTPNKSWTWITNQWNIRIYFGTDKEYNWYMLKWK
jgi:hypothetical protein